MTPRHFVAHGKLSFARDVDFDLLDNSGIDIVATFHPIHRTLALELQFSKLVFVRLNDLADFVADRTGIDLDVIVHHGQLPQKRLRDFAIGRDDDFARLGVDHIERNFFSEQDV